MPQPRRWIKLYCYERLHDSIVTDLTESEQSVWDKLLCMAGLCGYDGVIADQNRHPFSRAFITHELHTTRFLLASTIKKCITTGKIVEDGEGIKIVDWDKHQSEYSRQKPYRKAAAVEDPDKYVKGKYGHVVNR